VAHAQACIRGRRPALLFTHGVSGAGKTTVTQALLERLGAVRVRSDVERKRLHGLAAADRSDSAPGGGLYGEAATRATYAELARLAGGILADGYGAIVDAACLARWQRDLLRGAAAQAGAPHLLVECAADPEELRARVRRRGQAGTDASEATPEVLERQLRSVEPLAADETGSALIVDTGRWSAEDIAARAGRALEEIA
jgi:hypothetical protein